MSPGTTDATRLSVLPILMDEVCRLMRRAADAPGSSDGPPSPRQCAAPPPMTAARASCAHDADSMRATDWPRPLPRDEEPSASDLFDSAEV